MLLTTSLVVAFLGFSFSGKDVLLILLLCCPFHNFLEYVIVLFFVQVNIRAVGLYPGWANTGDTLEVAGETLNANPSVHTECENTHMVIAQTFVCISEN
jgi:hypothetical protein